jgi:hypothetical protein
MLCSDLEDNLILHYYVARLEIQPRVSPARRTDTPTLFTPFSFPAEARRVPAP